MVTEEISLFWSNIDFLVNISLMFLIIFFLNFLIEENINKVKYIHLIVVFFFFCLIFNSEFYLNSFFLDNFSNNDTTEIFYNLIDENKLFYCHFIFFASIIILTILFFGFYQNTLMKYSKDFEFTFLILLFFISSLCLFFSTQFIEVFICLECISFCSYVLIGMERVNKLNAITGIRYLILSTIPSCLVILGGIFIYENYGSFILNNVELFLESFAPINNDVSFFENITLFNGLKSVPITSETNGYWFDHLTSLESLSQLVGFENLVLHDYFLVSIYLAIIMVLINLLFKITGAPFHVWAPVIYNQGPLSSVTFLATFSKFIIVLFLINLFTTIFYFAKPIWSYVFLFVSLLSVWCGMIGAFSQQFIKKFFIYSSMTDVGFLLLGCTFYNIENQKSLFNYLFIYTLSSLLVWFSFLYLQRDTKFLVNLQSILSKNPILTLIFSLNIFSLAGIPPFGGFFIKLDILIHLVTSSHFFIALLLLLLTVINFYYYLRLIKILYFETYSFEKLNKESNKIKYEKLLIFVILIHIVCFYEFFTQDIFLFLFDDFMKTMYLS